MSHRVELRDITTGQPGQVVVVCAVINNETGTEELGSYNAPNYDPVQAAQIAQTWIAQADADWAALSDAQRTALIDAAAAQAALLQPYQGVLSELQAGQTITLANSANGG